MQGNGDESEEESAASLSLEKDRMPTREELIKNIRYTNLNVSSDLPQEEFILSTSWVDFV